MFQSEDPIEELTNVGYLILFGAVAWMAWKIYDSFYGANADNGKPKCSTTDMSAGNCVGSDGTACGWWEFFTATSCYKGTPKTTPSGPIPITASGADLNTSTSDMLGSIFTYEGATPTAPAPPGAPAGCNLQTGIGC
jgi:hypothetical protein